jgi:tetratricopeptide (TPR) repeat protein
LGIKYIVTDPQKFSNLKSFIKKVAKINIFKENLNISSSKWIENKDFETAVLVYEFMTELYPEDPELYSNLGRSYSEISKLDDALINYEKCIELSPDNKDVKEKIEAIKRLKN